MPELPEVETIRRALTGAIVNRTIARIETFTAKLREPLDSLTDLRIAGRKVTAVRRRGRYLLADLDDRYALLIHLGMTGVLHLEPAAAPRRKHDHVVIAFADGRETLRLEDPRRFGIVKFTKLAADRLPAELADFGPEPLSDAFSGAVLYQAGRGRNLPLKSLIMDNGVVVGVGNIYATEALYQAGLSPLLPAGKLTRKSADALALAIKTVLTAAIRAGGTTFSDYRKLDGSEGHFAVDLQVYGRAGEPCRRCGAILQKTVIGGRTSAYCPKCQKLPKTGILRRKD